MAVNADKPLLWKADVLQSIDLYNAWFMQFAPHVYRNTRVITAAHVESTLKQTDNLRNIEPALLRQYPNSVAMLRMRSMDTLDTLEAKRMLIQAQADQTKSPQARNQLGQFATPQSLAREILACAKDLLRETTPINFLDPAFGTGSFYSALLQTFPPTQISQACGFEIDPYYANKAAELWRDAELQLRIEDFTVARAPQENGDKANLLVCNPPYVRHHHLTRTQKANLQSRISPKYTLSALAGLYCYFFLIADEWLADGGIGAWLVPSEFLDVNYGKTIKQYLLKNVTLLRIHLFASNDTQFTDALVSSAVVFFAKAPPQDEHLIDFTYGGTLLKPMVAKAIPAHALDSSAKWSALATKAVSKNHETCEMMKLAQLFTIKRGLATGANDFFIISEKKAEEYRIPPAFLTPILPSARYLRTNEIQTDSNGIPLIDKKLFLIDCDLPEDQIAAAYPPLWHYLQKGIETGINQKYLCSHRSPWYAQEQRPAPLFLCTYMGRQSVAASNPFRFILNHSKATAANSYLLLYPNPTLAPLLNGHPKAVQELWEALNAITPASLMKEGRVYGGGLHKLEPKELANAMIPRSGFWANLLDEAPKQMNLFSLTK